MMYTLKLGLTGAYIIFLFFSLKHRLWVPVRTASISRGSIRRFGGCSLVHRAASQVYGARDTGVVPDNQHQ